jgi:hypothetical protein
MSEPKNGMQSRMILQSRAESVLDPRIPLAYPVTPRPEVGLHAIEYFKRKHAKDGPGPGRFYPLHRPATHHDAR